MGTVHVVPLFDQVHHVVPGLDTLTEFEQQAPITTGWLTVQVYEQDLPGQPCACGPSTEHVPNDHGPDGWMVTHHSLDAREQHE